MRIPPHVEIVNISKKARRLVDPALVQVGGYIQLQAGESGFVPMSCWHRHCNEPWWRRKEALTKSEAEAPPEAILTESAAESEPEAETPELEEVNAPEKRRPGRPRKETVKDD